MGKTHMAVGTALFCAYYTPTHWNELPSWGIGLAVTIFTSLLPDIDEPRSRIGGILLPFTPSWIRSYLFVLIGIVLLWQGWGQMIPMIIGFLLLFFVFVKHRESPTHGLIGLVSVSTLAYVVEPTLLVPALIGYGSHLFLDCITEGISFFYPAKKRICFPITKTNSRFERWLFYRGASLFTLFTLCSSSLNIYHNFYTV